MATRHPGWHREDIKAAVRKSGITLSELSRRHGLAVATCRTSLSIPVPAGNRAISAWIGVPLHELWPDWYGPDGKVLPGAYRPRARRSDAPKQSSTAEPRRARQEEEAA